MSYWAAGSTVAGAAIGAFGSGGGTGTVHAVDSIPEFLRDDYQNLSGQVQGLQTPEYYQGNQIAGMNPWMSGSLADMGAWGGGVGGDMMNGMYGSGAAGLGAFNDGMGYLNSAAGGPGFQYDQGTYDQAFGNLSGGMQNAFDLGAQQMQQDFDWNFLPGLDMQGALTGQQGSTKQYQQGALGQAMTDQNIANFGSGLWQNAANQAHGAAMTGGMENMQNQSNLLNAYGNFGQLGGNMMNNAWNMGTGNMQQGLQAGQIQQGFDQSQIDADMNKWNFEQQAPWTALQSQLGMLPGPGGYSPGTPGMSPWEGAMQGAMAGAGLYGAGQDQGWWGQQAPSNNYIPGMEYNPIISPQTNGGYMDTSGWNLG